MEAGGPHSLTRPEVGREGVVVLGGPALDHGVPGHDVRQLRQLLKTRTENAAGRAERSKQNEEQDRSHAEADWE